MDSVNSDRRFSCQVSPFRNPWIIGYLLLPAAYRSLSRLSSALSAKASALCSFLHDQSLLSQLVSFDIALSTFLPLYLLISRMSAIFRLLLYLSFRRYLLCMKFSRYVKIYIRRVLSNFIYSLRLAATYPPIPSPV